MYYIRLGILTKIKKFVSKRIVSRFLFSIVGFFLSVILVWESSQHQHLKLSSNLTSLQSLPSIIEPAAATEVGNVDATLAEKIANVFISSCPMVEPGDNNAQEQCANKLAKSQVLRDSMPDEVRWGGAKRSG